MKNSNDTIGNRTRDLLTCSAVPQPTPLPRAPAWPCTTSKQTQIFSAIFFPVHHAQPFPQESFAVKLSTQNNQPDRSIALALLLLLCSDVNALSLQNKRSMARCACFWRTGVPWLMYYNKIDITHAHKVSFSPCVITQVPQNLISCVYKLQHGRKDKAQFTL